MENPMEFGTIEDDPTEHVPAFAADELRNQPTGFSTDVRYIEQLMEQDYKIGDHLD
jgi:hypothetical protein